ncbi:Polysaccharide deacetylase [Sphingomonas sp. YR710]|uniref:polysaccharide deacetylase family protein n=1 Tax=Sphingomonas sp. YR710 TaxID=1882773 RepID=UPI0008837B4F|nr:polysaccharide deacetylase family protein [Sphingomonas sp. YR710]SDD80209.1 Polysaccharide deacetylase [Sphingomonas sp. YR710]
MHEQQHGRSPQPMAMDRRAVVFAGLAVAFDVAVPIRVLAAREVRTIPILAYHRFDPSAPGPTTVTIRTFESQLHQLAEYGYHITRLRDVVAASRDGGGETTRQAAITVDDGHRSVFTVLFPLIRQHRTPVTLFIYPSAISNADYAMTWDQLREMQASGLVNVQSHTYWHPNFKIERRRRSSENYRAFVDDQLQRSKATLEARLRIRVDMLAWPFGIVDADLEAAARKAGYAAALAYRGGPMAPGADLLALPRIPVGDTDRGMRFAALIGATGPVAAWR